MKTSCSVFKVEASVFVDTVFLAASAQPVRTGLAGLRNTPSEKSK
jgi:hypothetical protein